MAGHSAVSFLRNFCVSPKELRSIMDSAPIFTASLTFSSSISISFQSLEVPRFTLIFVFSIEPMALGTILVCSLLQGIIAFPSAIRALSFSGAICSFFAAASISFVMIPFLAASICVVYSLIDFLLFTRPERGCICRMSL